MSESQTYILTFNNEQSYETYKQRVIASGGTIKNDLGPVLLGFTAVIPPTLVQSIRSNSLVGSGITTFEPDSVVTIQD